MLGEPWFARRQRASVLNSPSVITIGRDASRRRSLADARHQVQHVGATRRAEVLLPRLEIAGGIVFEIRMVPAQTVLADVIGAG